VTSARLAELRALCDEVQIAPTHTCAYFIATARTELPKALDELVRLRTTIGELLARNGCDCDCEHGAEDHDEGCERCLACRIAAALDGEA
jgi:hypothetical protein